MDNLIETIEYKGYNINIYPDDNPDSPRNWDNLGTMVCFHRRYDLGDKTDLNSGMFEGWEELEEHLIKEKQAVVIAPLYLYDHSGISIKIGSFYGCGLPQGHARFDSGQIGFIYVDKETLIKEYGKKKITKKIKDKAREILEGEVKTYDDYVSGSVYGYQVKDKKENDIDSCWGFFGDTDYMIKEAKSNIDFDIEAKRKQKNKKLKVLMKNKVALNTREKILK